MGKLIKSTDIDVVIIGRNDSHNLKTIISPRIRELKRLNQLFYIDSQSTDESVNIALAVGLKTIIVTKADFHCASLGRHIGALASESEYILFIDSDMEFLSTEKLTGIINEKIDDESIVGYTGRTTDVFPNGSKKERFRSKADKSDTRFFGGLLLIKRTELLAAGNWNPGIRANEEIELYARLKARNKRILFDKRVHCNHYTYHKNKIQYLFNAYFPTSIRSARQYGAYGIAIKESARAGALSHLISIAPEPILTTATTVCTILLLTNQHYIPSVALLLVYSIWIKAMRSFSYLLVAPSTQIHFLVGLFRKSKNNFEYKTAPSASD